MIGFLRGILLDRQPPRLLIDVQGIGYEVEATMTVFYDLPEIGTEISLFTHLVVREDAHSLFGFAGLAERDMFRDLIRINGVGPRLALTILSGMSAEEFAMAIQAGDPATLTRLPGVGKKTAERLIIEMKDRLDVAVAADGVSGKGTLTPVPVDPVTEAVSALVALGYKPAEASKLIRGMESGGMSSEQIIRQALKSSVRQ